MTDTDPNKDMEDELRNLFRRVDPVPQQVTEFAQAALGWRRLDTELAELLADSALDTDMVALARGGVGRSLSFGGDDLTIDVEISSDGETHTLLGQLAPPPASATIEAQAGDGAPAGSVESDELGRFRLTLEGGGRVRLRIVRPDASPVETSWFTV